VKLTDTHCHLDFQDYQEDFPEILERARSAGLNRILIPAIDLESSRNILALVETDPILFAAVGVHPNSGTSWGSNTLKVLKEIMQHPKVMAVGEIGLDYYRDRTPRDAQREILVSQLQLAQEMDLPVILHVRNASEQDRTCIEDLLMILEREMAAGHDLLSRLGRVPGVIHSFSGNLEEGQRALRAGYYLGVTGPVTFKKADQLRDVVRAIDTNCLLTETDGPFLAPQPFRGRRNEPAHVRYIVDKISEVKGLPVEMVARQTAENAARIFQWE
jgi:TatD DNase family protein